MATSKRKELYFKLIIIGISLLLFFAGLRYLLWAGWIEWESKKQNFEIKRYDQQKKKSKRVLVLGDSQLERWPIEHSLYRDIGKYCHQQGWGYVNAAHHGFGPTEYRNNFLNIAPNYQPDLTIVFYYAGNDLTDVMYREGPTPKTPSHGNVTLKPMERSSFYRPKAPKPITGLSQIEREQLLAPHPFNWEQFRRSGIDEEMITFAENRLINPKSIGAEFVNPHVLVFGSWKPNQLYDNLAINSSESRYAWYQILEEFDRIYAQAQAIGSQLVFVVIPSTVQIDDSHHDFYRRTKFRLGPELLDHKQPQAFLQDYSKYYKLPYVDLLDAFKTKSSEEALYFENDDHLNSNGHLLAFEQVKAQILEPYSNGSLVRASPSSLLPYSKLFIGEAVNQQIQIIRNTPDWLEAVKQKAEERKMSLDSTLYQDALFVLSQKK